MKAETGQRSQPGVEIRSETDEGTSLVAHNVEISHWAQAVFATLGIASVEVTGSRMEQLGTGAIEVHTTVDNASITIVNNLLTTREDADVVVAVGKPQGLGATLVRHLQDLVARPEHRVAPGHVHHLRAPLNPVNPPRRGEY